MKITDHAHHASSDSEDCVTCGYAREAHDYEWDGDYPNGPERDDTEFEFARFELGE